MSEEAKRNITPVRYDVIYAEFLKVMGQIGHYGAETYGDLNWHKSRLSGGKGPVNHMMKHLISYQKSEPYDHKEIGADPKIHLAAVAFNAMMEFWYLENIDEGQDKVQRTPTTGSSQSRGLKDNP